MVILFLKLLKNVTNSPFGWKQQAEIPCCSEKTLILLPTTSQIINEFTGSTLLDNSFLIFFQNFRIKK